MKPAAERVLILGATSKIATEVALVHRARGDRIHLVGRSAEKLEALRTLLPEATIEAADLSDFAACDALVDRAVETLGGLDRALIAHGELGDQIESERSWEVAERAFAVNLLSAVALVLPLTRHFEARGRGRLGVITSVAGERGRPRNYTYGAAKGGLSIYLEGVRSRLFSTDISVTTLKLGPVDTPMTVGHEKNALFGQPDVVARGIVQAMDRGRANVFLPGVWRWILLVVRLLPEWLFQRFGFLSGR